MWKHNPNAQLGKWRLNNINMSVLGSLYSEITSYDIHSVFSRHAWDLEKQAGFLAISRIPA